MHTFSPCDSLPQRISISYLKEIVYLNSFGDNERSNLFAILSPMIKYLKNALNAKVLRHDLLNVANIATTHLIFSQSPQSLKLWKGILIKTLL